MKVSTEAIQKLDDFFKLVKLPKSIQIGPGETLTDVPRFLESHFAIVKSFPDVSIYEVFYLRLLKIKELLSEQE